MQQINTEKQVICSACHLKFYDVPSYKLHRSTEFHIYNTKRQIADLEPISEEVFEQKRASKSINQSISDVLTLTISHGSIQFERVAGNTLEMPSMFKKI